MFNIQLSEFILGITTVVSRYAKANNEYAEVNDPKTKKTYLLYPDTNNLYGISMLHV